MENSTGIMIVLGVIGLLAIVAVSQFVIQRRQLSSGRNGGCFFPHKQDGKHVFDRLVTITAGEKWCRLLLGIKAQESYRIDYTPKYFFERAAQVIGTSYTLTISDTSGRVLYREDGALSRFVAWLKCRESRTETLFGERGTGAREGRITLLEFFLRQAGSYRIFLEIQSRAEDEAPGSSSYWEMLEADLTLLEGVIPLSKTVKYPHNRVRI